MRILIDARLWGPGGAGKSRYVAELLPPLMAAAPDDRFELLVSPGFSAALGPNAGAIEVARAPLLGLPRLASRVAADLFYSPSSYLLPLRVGVPTVIVVHDAAVWREPRARPALKTKVIERLAAGPALARARGVIADSESTARDVASLFPGAAAKLRVILPGVPASAAPRPGAIASLGLRPGFVLFVGTIEPRKNIETLIRAYAGLPPELRERAPLVLAGRRGWNMRHLDALIELCGAAGQIRELGFVPDDVLPALYAAAGVVVCPSWYEGFDFPVLEGMRHGAPVIASNTSSHPQVVGQAGIFFEPGDAPSLARHIADVLQKPELAARLTALGRGHVTGFSWRRAAEATLDVFRRAVE